MFFVSVSNAKCSHFLQKIKRRSKFDFCLNRHNKQHIRMIPETRKKCIVIYNEMMPSIHQVHRGVSNLTRLVSFRNFKKAIQTGLDFSCILYIHLTEHTCFHFKHISCSNWEHKILHHSWKIHEIYLASRKTGRDASSHSRVHGI